jgi:cold shock CspA family protein
VTSPIPGVMSGTVAEYSADIGLGVIEADDVRYPFHCIEIADGSREIAVGTAVTFDVLCKLGRYEAASIN